MRHNLILPDDYQDKKLKSYHDGTMALGLGIECDLDKHIRYKPGQFNLLMGIDNVGKTFFRCWYYVCLAHHHGLTFCIYSTENEVWSIKMKLMSFYAGKHIKNLDDGEYYRVKSWVEGHFTFVDDTGFYSMEELLEVFDKTECNGCLIDPHNSLKIPRGIDKYSYNVESLGWCRKFTKETGKTLDINGHCVTEASRRIHKDGIFEGLIMPPEKSHWDGGQIFPNRCDDFIILHRYFRKPYRVSTMVYIDKIKETETGGDRTDAGEPVVLEFKEYGFTCNHKNPLKDGIDYSPQMQDILDAAGGMENFKQDDEPPF